jgi:hypothetical protein
VSVFDEIRAAAQTVAERARFVHIDDERLRDLADRLVPDLESLGDDDPAHVRLASEADTLAFVISLDAVNFGSGWFPRLRKSHGHSGYFTVATALRAHFESQGAWTPTQLADLSQADCADIFGQDPAEPEVGELMALFARSLSDLGRHLQTSCGGSFGGLLARAKGRADKLVAVLAEMPLYRDVSEYDGHRVPLYKRAQITAADLALAFGEQGPGHFDDIDSLTLFADNLVPHVLRCEGVLGYEPSLLEQITAGELIAPGCREEVEIRAVAVHAVERMADHLASGGAAHAAARALDRVLWSRGQSPAIKSKNRHRTHSVFY